MNSQPPVLTIILLLLNTSGKGIQCLVCVTMQSFLSVHVLCQPCAVCGPFFPWNTWHEACH